MAKSIVVEVMHLYNERASYLDFDTIKDPANIKRYHEIQERLLDIETQCEKLGVK